MNILSEMEAHGHQQIVACCDPSVGLRAFIAIFDTTLGPALGGVRWCSYASEHDALRDVMRLAHALTYKCAIAGTGFGGGKAVILAHQEGGGSAAGAGGARKTEALLRAFARFVDSLGGRFIVSEDVGTDTRDLEYIARETRHVAGLPVALGGSGDPAESTAMGVVATMHACAEAAWGSDSLTGRTVAIQGLGKVGMRVAKRLVDAGAKIVATDFRDEALERVRALGAEIVAPTDIYAVDCDVLSPCAMGAVLNPETIPRIQARIVAGAANNQLGDPSDGDALDRRGILYAPDFVASAGGVMALHLEVYGEFRSEVLPRLAADVGRVMREVIRRSQTDGIPTHRAADRIAEERITSVRGIRMRRAAYFTMGRRYGLSRCF